MVPFAAASRSAPLLQSPCEDDNAQREGQVVDEEQQRNANVPPCCAFAVDMDVGNGEVGA